MIRRLVAEGQCRGVHLQFIAAAITPARPAMSGLGSTWSSGSTVLERQRPHGHSMASSWHPATRSSLRCFAQSAEPVSDKAGEGDGSPDSAGHAEKKSNAQEAAASEENTAGADAGAGDKAEATADSTNEASDSGQAGAPEDTAASGKANAAEEQPKAPSETPEERLECEVAELQEKVRSKKNNLLLALADFENEKKRHAKERESRRRKAVVNFAGKMVEIYTEFDLRFKASDTKETAALSDSCKSLQEGVDLTVNLHKSTLERFGVEQFSVEPGQPFVGARHESLGSIECEDLAVNSVAEQVQPGWHLKEGTLAPSVLRKAQVRTVRQGPESPPPPP
mmetsp:Transcript_124172/g.247413  ORF Transcript_124172/g.247413 Transcript_124172/m.247413 type:complete len:338 (+) Transcript_124172:110-1123(+)|eukprot:CAMPEP_0172815468 /NCGR_PEP_ID=MMETSP1075-20121228/11774_1 /TAXON_ID=2916 /ORGANISM="Ceratium fusus, Strain PA161109" /LENGTH=337 /DNA_ID=CAMNT_0013655311 /DNA_START=30 /DNA_END=1043 /DNA_ORIENTATION=-